MSDKPVCNINFDGNRIWILNHIYHREDGPAIERVDRYKAWYINDKCHRIDGPAVERVDGSGYWFMEGQSLYPEEAVKDLELQAKYPKLIEAMIVYLVHNS